MRRVGVLVVAALIVYSVVRVVSGLVGGDDSVAGADTSAVETISSAIGRIARHCRRFVSWNSSSSRCWIAPSIRNQISSRLLRRSASPTANVR